jgi:hypothetical protein
MWCHGESLQWLPASAFCSRFVVGQISQNTTRSAAVGSASQPVTTYRSEAWRSQPKGTKDKSRARSHSPNFFRSSGLDQASIPEQWFNWHCSYEPHINADTTISNSCVQSLWLCASRNSNKSELRGARAEYQRSSTP